MHITQKWQGRRCWFPKRVDALQKSQKGSKEGTLVSMGPTYSLRDQSCPREVHWSHSCLYYHKIDPHRTLDIVRKKDDHTYLDGGIHPFSTLTMCVNAKCY